jgi:hypothetical protein
MNQEEAVRVLAAVTDKWLGETEDPATDEEIAEARLALETVETPGFDPKCRCCRNNWDDPEHRHSPVCSPDYKEGDVDYDWPVDHEEGE